MPQEILFIVISGIIGVTVTVSVVALSIAHVIASRRKRSVDTDVQAAIEARLARIENAVDAVATEVERVAADQRAATRRLDAPARHP